MWIAGELAKFLHGGSFAMGHEFAKEGILGSGKQPKRAGRWSGFAVEECRAIHVGFFCFHQIEHDAVGAAFMGHGGVPDKGFGILEENLHGGWRSLFAGCNGKAHGVVGIARQFHNQRGFSR